MDTVEPAAWAVHTEVYSHAGKSTHAVSISNIYALLQSYAKFYWSLAQAFVCLFRDLRSVQLFHESSSKREHRHLVEKVNLYLCAKLAG